MATSRYDFKTEGKDPVNKMIGSLKTAILGSCISGLCEVVIYQPGKSFGDVFTRFGKHALLWTGVTTTFTTTVLFLTNMRKKDDPWNYFFGAHASCAVMYSITKHGRTAFSLAVLSSLALALVKYTQLQGTDPFHFPHIRKVKSDMFIDVLPTPDFKE